MMSESFCFNFFERLCNTLPKVLILDYFFLKYERWGGGSNRYRQGKLPSKSIGLNEVVLIHLQSAFSAKH